MKRTFLLIIIALTFGFINAQTPVYLKVSEHGSFENIEHLNSGGYITVGYDSVYKLQITRWDESFSPIWNYKFTDANITSVSPKIVEANDGNFYFMTASNEHTGSTLIVKFSSAGSLLWQKIYYITTGNMNSFSLSKAIVGDNGFLFGGGQCTLNNYVIKCDQTGNIEWQTQYYYPLSTGVTTCLSIIPDGNNYVLTSSYNVNSLLISKVSALGTVVSQSAYTYTGMQIVPIKMVKLNQNGGYAVVGNYNNSNDNKTEFVAIYNSLLELLSFNELTVTYTQFTLRDIVAINNGRNVVVSGNIYDNSAFNQAVVCLSNTGSVVWKKRAEGNVGSNRNVEFRGITQKGNYIVNAGHGYNDGSVISMLDTNGNGLCNNITFNLVNSHKTLALQTSSITPTTSTVLNSTVNYTHNSLGSYSKYIYCGELSTMDIESSTPLFSIFPNPAQDKVYISFSMNTIGQNASILIYDLTGKLICKYSNLGTNNQVEIDTSNLKQGVYLIQIKGNNGLSEVRKLIIS